MSAKLPSLLLGAIVPSIPWCSTGQVSQGCAVFIQDLMSCVCGSGNSQRQTGQVMWSCSQRWMHSAQKRCSQGSAMTFCPRLNASMHTWHSHLASVLPAVFCRATRIPPVSQSGEDVRQDPRICSHFPNQYNTTFNTQGDLQGWRMLSVDTGTLRDATDSIHGHMWQILML